MQEKWFQRERTYGSPHGLYFEATHQPNFQARLAEDLMKAWQPVSPQGGGEDSAGRGRVRLMEPAELAKRACDVAQAMCDEFHERGWFVPVEVVPNSRG